MIGRLYRTTHGSKPVLAIGQASAERAWSPSDTWDACMSNTIMALTAPYQRPAPAASAAQERQEVITIASNATRVTRITWEGSDLAAARFIWRENLAVAVATWRYPLTAGLLESLSSRPVTL
ncbi:MAG TPA: hypothetical protein VMV92_26550 [Streptosporangiaceae bacterium]|nr:hypothetical protein [Streptosporangiaceae bacterium]